MPPAVHEDGAASLRTVGDGQAFDARRVAPEVTRERISLIGATCGAVAGRQKRGAGRKTAAFTRDGCEGILSVEVHSFRHYRNACSFKRSHQAWLLQHLGQIAVERGVPANSGLQR